jgi:hypothetical protein
MVELGLTIGSRPAIAAIRRLEQKQKADVVKHPGGVEPRRLTSKRACRRGDLPFIQSSDHFEQDFPEPTRFLDNQRRCLHPDMANGESKGNWIISFEHGTVALT